MIRGTHGGLIAAAAILAGGVGWIVGTEDVPDPLPVGDRVQAAVDGLRDTNVYVAPDSADLLSDDDRARLSAVAAESRPEAFVVVWETTSEGGFYLATDGVRQIGAELGRPGYYVSIGRGGVASDDVGIDGDYVSADHFGPDEEVTSASVAARITQILQENQGREFSEGSTSGSDYWGGPGGTLAAGLLIGALAGLPLAAAVVAVWFVVRGRLRRRS